MPRLPAGHQLSRPARTSTKSPVRDWSANYQESRKTKKQSSWAQGSIIARMPRLPRDTSCRDLLGPRRNHRSGTGAPTTSNPGKKTVKLGSGVYHRIQCIWLEFVVWSLSLTFVSLSPLPFSFACLFPYFVGFLVDNPHFSAVLYFCKQLAPSLFLISLCALRSVLLGRENALVSLRCLLVSGLFGARVCLDHLLELLSVELIDFE